MFTKLLARCLPAPLIRAWRRQAAARMDARFARLSPTEVFGAIYREQLWGNAPNSDYYSGDGSHHPSLVEPYVRAVRNFLAEFPAPPTAVDLGCGDFNVGSQLRDCCSQFVASDVVQDLIARNMRMFANLDVSFQSIDIVRDGLPVGEVAFLRQVLQHLNNAQINAIIPKLYQYRWLIVSEHLPADDKFVANCDKPVGPGVRERFRSGVVLTAPPFHLCVKYQRILCSVAETPGVIQTIAYRLGGSA